MQLLPLALAANRRSLWIEYHFKESFNNVVAVLLLTVLLRENVFVAIAVPSLRFLSNICTVESIKYSESGFVNNERA